MDKNRNNDPIEAQITLEISKEIVNKLTLLAEEKGKSLNELINILLKEAIK
tara:strand:- start:704 stop:856 length:153 start_codon:yes stop_codon:yes gene_type:complete